MEKKYQRKVSKLPSNVWMKNEKIANGKKELVIVSINWTQQYGVAVGLRDANIKI
jgi:hypothetical protein